MEPADVDLVRLRAVSEPDAYLQDLVELADQGITALIGVLINGMVAVGTLVGSEKIAEAVDDVRVAVAEIARGVDLPEGLSQEDYGASLDALGTRMKTAHKKIEARRRATFEEAVGYVDDDRFDERQAPADLTRRMFLASTRAHLTLIQPKIYAPGQNGLMSIPILRVPMSQISGWWPIPVDENGTAQVTFFEQQVDPQP